MADGFDIVSYLMGKQAGGGGGGGSGVPRKTVNFVDYDGSVIYAYTAEEFAALSDLPALPSHTGLTAQKWGWTKAQITAQLTAMPTQPISVGIDYITASGATELDIELEADALSPFLVLAPDGTVDVDWGDGSTHSTMTGTSLSTEVYAGHTYAAAGKYKIKLSASSGSYALYDTGNNYPGVLRITAGKERSRKYAAKLTSVRIGSNVSIGGSAFNNCCSLQSVTIPSGVTSIGGGAFSNCYSVDRYILLRTTPPTLDNSNAFSGIQSYTKIIVPYSADHSVLAAYKSTQNWSTYADYMEEAAA